MINAAEAEVGRKYQTTSGIVIEVLEKREKDIVVKSEETGHTVIVPATYKLNPIIEAEIVKSQAEERIKNLFKQETPAVEEKVMSDETMNAPVEQTSAKKVKKSNIVDQGLQSNLSVDDIVKSVLAAFPEAPEKSVRNLISVRRSKMKAKIV